jgi:hypothetical protein
MERRCGHEEKLKKIEEERKDRAKEDERKEMAKGKTGNPGKKRN